MSEPGRRREREVDPPTCRDQRPVLTPEEWARIRADHAAWLRSPDAPERWRADVTGKDFAGIVLRGVDLREARLRNCRLVGQDLRSTLLDGADLEGSCLSNANLERNGHLKGVNLDGAELDGAVLRGAFLDGASAEGTSFRGADLTGASLVEADLRHTDWTGARLQGASLTRADLREADLRRVERVGVLKDLWHTFFPALRVPFTLDDTRVREARFAARSRDPWSVLRRAYTGPRMIFVMLLSLAALLPVMFQAAVYRVIDRAERLAVPVVVDAVRRAAARLDDLLPPPEALDPADAAAKQRIRDARDWIRRAEALVRRFDAGRAQVMDYGFKGDEIRALLDALEEAESRLVLAYRDRAGSVDRRLKGAEVVPAGQSDDAIDRVIQARRLLLVLLPEVHVRIDAVPVARLIFGLHRDWWTFALTSALILYNVLRFGLTYTVSPMRDEEERSGHTPEASAYTFWLYHVGNRLCSLLGLLALIAGSVQTYHSLTTEILIPRFAG